MLKQTDRQRYHDTTSPDLFVRKLKNAKNTNAFVLRIAWSVFLWNSRKIQIAKDLADVINRHVGNPDAIVSPELKEKAVGFADYSD